MERERRQPVRASARDAVETTREVSREMQRFLLAVKECDMRQPVPASERDSMDRNGSRSQNAIVSASNVSGRDQGRSGCCGRRRFGGTAS